MLAGMVLLPALAVGLADCDVSGRHPDQRNDPDLHSQAGSGGVVLMLPDHWMLQVLMTFTINLIESIPELIQ